ncbi:aminoglycoside phosphotransferase [Pedobacter sp. Leaf41]|uniref:phosphotransferase enzyme family protein n=1 Tax=Pedobacter sp. Leaf41 TaxID=1736218 RepID=UPI000702EE5C|nr:aminoglycoside phosphotransferase family protein [Pedobacter sp. Leaf41]KQN30910.1 aminoglycoside phosphotransferase [Pedobacter sp. Leaf41]
MILEVLKAFGLDGSETKYRLFGGGLINNTWKVSTVAGDFILQQINTDIFAAPEKIIDNIVRLQHYLEKKAPEYLFVGPVKTTAGQSVLHIDGFAFRCFPFIQKSITIEKVEHAKQAYEAAKQFGKFTCLLNDFDASSLSVSLPDFHNLNLRVSQYQKAVELADDTRLSLAAGAIAELNRHMDIADRYNDILKADILKIRTFHHDTKISNVLLHEDTGLGMCIIDLDTLMPGYFISDVGDMMRTYLSPVTEEETDFNLIAVRIDIFEAIYSGYMSEMGPVLKPSEQQLFIYSGQFMIFMQALRFLTDFLNGDIYYGAAYPNHNLNRAQNQIHLLNQYIDSIPRFEEIIQDKNLRQIKISENNDDEDQT